jgi:hypothetical protein
MGRYVVSDKNEQQEMLKTLGLKTLDDLYRDVDRSVLNPELDLPEGKSEMQVARIMEEIADKNVRFQGTYSPTVIYSTTNDNLFLGAENKLYWPSTEGYTLGACRAYFHVDLNGGAAAVRQFVLNFGDDNEQTNGIVEMRNEEGEMRNVNGEVRNGSAVWYTLDGRKVNSHLSPLTSHPSPLKKGLYINNGKKVVIK